MCPLQPKLNLRQVKQLELVQVWFDAAVHEERQNDNPTAFWLASSPQAVGRKSNFPL
jgi:hypothetical protein